MNPRFCRLIPTLLLFLGAHQALQAQDSTHPHATGKDTLLVKKPAHSYFEASIDYQNNSVYLGRKDSVTLPYFIPALNYYHKSGVYLSASASYLNNSSSSRIDLVTLGAGYHFSAGPYTGDLLVSKYFYNSQSTSVTSEIKSSVSYHNSYNLGFIKPNFTFTLNLGDKSDFGGAFGLEHSFWLFDDAFEITPSFTANASTQNYYNNYYKTRRFSRKKGAVTGTVNITGTVVNPSSFKILDYEAALPLSYEAGKFIFSFTPTYALPVHPAEVDLHYAFSTGMTKTKVITESIGNVFFWTLGVSYRF